MSWPILIFLGVTSLSTTEVCISLRAVSHRHITLLDTSLCPKAVIPAICCLHERSMASSTQTNLRIHAQHSCLAFTLRLPSPYPARSSRQHRLGILHVISTTVFTVKLYSRLQLQEAVDVLFQDVAHLWETRKNSSGASIGSTSPLGFLMFRDSLRAYS